MNRYTLFYYINESHKVPVFLSSNTEFDLNKINPMLYSEDETIRKMALSYIKKEIDSTPHAINNKMYENYYIKFKMKLRKDN